MATSTRKPAALNARKTSSTATFSVGAFHAIVFNTRPSPAATAATMSILATSTVTTRRAPTSSRDMLEG